ncbi:MAG: RHS repeat-associated core domain-containing protein [Terracidiphilus sp.]
MRSHRGLQILSISIGKERDTESGNDYFGARYYASSMGRFLSPDWSDDPEAVPYADIGNPQSLNLYAYVNNKPLRATDAAHRAYNKAVEKLLKLDTPEGKQHLMDEGIDGAKEAARKVLDSNDPNVKGFLDNMKTPDGLIGRQALEGVLEGDEGALLDVVVDGAAGLAAVE